MKIFLIIILLVTVEVTARGEGFSSKEEKYKDNLILNHSFEDLGDDELPEHWKKWGGSEDTIIEQSDDKRADGSFTIKIEDNTETAGVGAECTPVAAEGGREYSAQVRIFREKDKTDFALYLQFFDNSGKRIGVKTALSTQSGKWEILSVKETAPAGSIKMNIMLYSGQKTVGTAWFDNAVLVAGNGAFIAQEPAVKPAASTQAGMASPTLQNPSFEEAGTEADIPMYWRNYNPAQIARRIKETSRHGSWAVEVISDSPKEAAGIESGPVAAKPGMMYHFTGDVLIKSGDPLVLYLQFYNAAGSRIGVYTAPVTAKEGWQKAGILGESPDGTESAKVLFYIGSTQTGHAVVDNAGLRTITAAEKLADDLRDVPLIKPVEYTHPRLYFTRKDIARIKKLPFKPAEHLLTMQTMPMSYISGKTIEYELPPKERFDADPPPGFKGLYPYWTGMATRYRDQIQDMVLSYYVSGDKRYAQRIIAYLDALAGWSRWTEHGKTLSLDISHLVFAYAIGYDAVYEFMNDTQRKKLMEAFVRLGLQPIADAGLRLVDHNITTLQHLALGMGGLAVLGESPRAALYVHIARQYCEWYLNEREQSLNHEGIGYTDFVMGNLLQFASVDARVTGSKKLLTKKYTAEVYPDWIIASMNPAGTGCAPFGDYSGELPGRFSMRIIANNGNGYAGWYLKKTGLANNRLFLDYMFEDPGRPVIEPPKEKTGMFVPRKGLVSMRSSYDDDAICLAVTACMSDMNHTHFDQASFVLYRGGNLIFSDPGYRDTALGWEEPTSAGYRFTVMSYGHNTLLVNGLGQEKRGNAKFTDTFFSPAFDYCRADAGAAYNSETVKSFTRSFYYLKPGLIVISDDIECSTPSKTEQLFHPAAGTALSEVPGNKGWQIMSPGAATRIMMLNKNAVMRSDLYPGTGRARTNLVFSGEKPAAKTRLVTLIDTRSEKVPSGIFRVDISRLEITEDSGQESKLVGADGINGLFYRGRETGKDYMQFNLEIPEAGNFNVSLHSIVATVYGIVEITIDNKKVGSGIDCYGEVIGNKLFRVGKISLEKGIHVLRITITGKNPKSSNYYTGLSALIFEKEGAGQIKNDKRKTAVITSYDDGRGVIGARVEDDDVTTLLTAEKTGSAFGLSLNGTFGAVCEKGGKILSAALQGSMLRVNEADVIKAAKPCTIALQIADRFEADLVSVTQNTAELRIPGLKSAALNGSGIDLSKQYKNSVLTITLTPGTNRIIGSF